MVDDKAEDGPFCAIPDGFGRRPYKQTHGVRLHRNKNLINAGGSVLAVMPEIDHCIGQCLERVMQLTEAFKTKQQSPELVFPSKHPFDRPKPFFKYRRVEQHLAASFGLLSTTYIRVDVGDHTAIKNGFAIGPAIIDAIQTDDTALQIHADGSGNAHHLGQGRAQQRRFIAVAWCCDERRDHVAVAIAEGDDLVAFQLLVPVEANVVAALLGGRRRAIAMDDRDIKTLVLVKLHHRAGKDGIHAAIVLPPAEGIIDPGVVDLRTALAILVNWQLLPLTAKIKQPQNVVEDLEQTQFRCGPTAADGQVRQDKLFKQSETQLRGNRLPTAASSHSDTPENRLLPDPETEAKYPACSAFRANTAARRNPQPVAYLKRFFQLSPTGC